MLICSLTQTCLNWEHIYAISSWGYRYTLCGNYSSRAPVTALSLLETVVFESTKVPSSELHRLPSSISPSNFSLVVCHVPLGCSLNVLQWRYFRPACPSHVWACMPKWGFFWGGGEGGEMPQQCGGKKCRSTGLCIVGHSEGIWVVDSGCPKQEHPELKGPWILVSSRFIVENMLCWVPSEWTGNLRLRILPEMFGQDGKGTGEET